MLPATLFYFTFNTLNRTASTRCSLLVLSSISRRFSHSGGGYLLWGVRNNAITDNQHTRCVTIPRPDITTTRESSLAILSKTSRNSHQNLGFIAFLFDGLLISTWRTYNAGFDTSTVSKSSYTTIVVWTRVHGGREKLETLTRLLLFSPSSCYGSDMYFIR